MVLYFDTHRSISLGDVAYTLQLGRKALSHRVVFICRDLEDVSKQMHAFIEKGEVRPLPSEWAEIKSWLAGNKIDWSRFHEGQLFRRIPLPTYPFTKTHCLLHTVERSQAPSHQPQQLMEKMLLSLWSHILHEEHIDTHTNFYALGGDSLAALEVVDHIRALFCIDISLHDFFAHPNIHDLSAFIEAKKKHLLNIH